MSLIKSNIRKDFLFLVQKIRNYRKPDGLIIANNHEIVFWMVTLNCVNSINKFKDSQLFHEMNI